MKTPRVAQSIVELEPESSHMAAGGRRTLIPIVAVSVAAHLAVFGLLALARPKFDHTAPPPPVFDVLIAPRFARPPAQAEPAPSRPLRARRAVAADRSPIPPLRLPESAIAPSAPAASTEPTMPTAPVAPARLKDALRRGPVGCANPSLLSREERDACLERLGAGAKDAPFIEPPMSPDKRRAFDAAAAKKEAYRRYKEANMPPGVTPEPKPSEAPNPFPEVWTPRR